MAEIKQVLVGEELYDIAAVDADIDDVSTGEANTIDAATLGGLTADKFMLAADWEDYIPKYSTFSITTSSWSLNSSTSMYEYVLSKAAVTSDMALIELNLDSTSQGY